MADYEPFLVRRPDSCEDQATRRRGGRSDSAKSCMTRSNASARSSARVPGRRGRSRSFGEEKHGFRLNPPLSEWQVRDFEDRHGIRLPEGYRLFLLHLGDGGAGPYYGLHPLSRALDLADEPIEGDLARPCPLVPGMPREDDWLERLGCSAEECFRGAIPIVHQGCTYYSLLVVSGAARGRVVNVDEELPAALLPGRPGLPVLVRALARRDGPRLRPVVVRLPAARRRGRPAGDLHLPDRAAGAACRCGPLPAQAARPDRRVAWPPPLRPGPRRFRRTPGGGGAGPRPFPGRGGGAGTPAGDRRPRSRPCGRPPCRPCPGSGPRAGRTRPDDCSPTPMRT